MGGSRRLRMVFSNVKKLAILAAMTGFLAASEAMAADVTDVLDAADEVYLGDEKVSDPFDISLTPKFVQRLESAKLKREYNQAGSIRLLNELEYKRTINEFDIDLEIGMFHDLSFRMHMPIIISDQQTYKFDTSSDEPQYHISSEGTTYNDMLVGISTLAPADSRINGSDRKYQFFQLKDGETLKGKKRTGFGDMSFGIAWSPYNTERHFIPERPWKDNTGRSTITLAFDYFAPTGKGMGIDNDAVGKGAHELLFTVAASHRFSFIDPYIRLQYGLPIGLEDSYKDYGSNQKRKDPGMWGRIDLGIEFIPYESIEVKFQRFVKIDLRTYFKYTAEGRAYSEISDALGTSDCYNMSTDDLKNNAKCAWVAEKWSNAGSSNIKAMADGTYSGPLAEDGLFDYEGFATIGGGLNLTVQPIQYIQVLAGFNIDYAQNHFVTFTKIGKDRVTLNNDGSISEGKDGVVTDNLYEERNPTFSGALDRVGQRIKRTESLNIEWFVGLKLMY